MRPAISIEMCGFFFIKGRGPGINSSQSKNGKFVVLVIMINSDFFHGSSSLVCVVLEKLSLDY